METRKLDQDPKIIDLRKSIDYYDISFIHLLAERVRVAGKIMHIKRKMALGPAQSEARKEDLKNLIEMSVQLKLEKTFFKKILDLVFQDAMEQFNTGRLINNPEEIDEICADLNIEDLRNNLYNLDRSLCLVLAERFRIVKRIGFYKDKLGVPPLDQERWQRVLETKSQVAQSLDISVPLIKDIYNSIHEVSLQIENEIAGALK